VSVRPRAACCEQLVTRDLWQRGWPIYDLLFKAAAETTFAIAADRKHLVVGDFHLDLNDKR
jgi:hypothetical protein